MRAVDSYDPIDLEELPHALPVPACNYFERSPVPSEVESLIPRADFRGERNGEHAESSVGERAPASRRSHLTMPRTGTLVRAQYLREIRDHLVEPLVLGPMKFRAWRAVLDTDMMYFSRFPSELGKVSVGFGSRSTGVVDVRNANRNTVITIGKFVHFGRDVRILDTMAHRGESITIANFNPTFGQDTPLEEIYNRGPIVIGNDTAVADEVAIMGNTTIPDGTAVGTKSLVTGKLEPYGIYGGVPAKLIRFRFPKETIDRLLRLAWWDFPPNVIWEHRKLFTTLRVEDALPKLEELARTLRTPK